MDHLMTLLPWVMAAGLYLEVGVMWLRWLMVTDTSKDRFAACMLDDMAGKNGGSAAAATRLVALCFILGWPAIMAFGWVNARREIKMEGDRG